MLTNTELALLKFKRFVAQQARTRLSKLKMNDSKGLYKKLDGVLKVNPKRISLSWDLGYGTFQDLGVKGKDPSKVSPNAKITGQQAPNSPYRFGTGSARGKWGQFVSSLEKWAKRKNVRFRDEKGKYVKGNYKSLAYVIANNIYARGIKPSLFFTKPFEQGFKKLPDEVLEAYGLDVEDYLKYTIKAEK
jgi:hypothetical protein|tara:strand:- start:2168 stop:2734 length:567 start_codon:yes stop_codon:yes gene_type:complete